LGVFEGQVGQDPHLGLDQAGGVEASTETGLDHRHVHSGLREGQDRRDRHDLEEGHRAEVGDGRLDPPEDLQQNFFSDRVGPAAIDPLDPLVEGVEVR
jgi:hypothetical protein